MKAFRALPYCTDFAAMGMFVLLLARPELASRPTAQALSFCAETLVPSLFVCLVLARLFVSMPTTARLYKVLGTEAVLLILGTLCGFPAGARSALVLYQSGAVTKKRAEYICAFTNNASASFLLGFVGSALFGDIRVGVFLLLLQLCASLLAALLLKRFMFGKSPLPPTAPPVPKRIGLACAITESALVMLNVCACTVFFVVASELVCALIPLSRVAKTVIKTAAEFSSGCAYAAGGKHAIVFCAAAVGFSGISVAVQIKSAVGNALSVKPYLAGRAMTGAFMTLFGLLVDNFGIF